jgi:uncharacterized Zn finger protein
MRFKLLIICNLCGLLWVSNPTTAQPKKDSLVISSDSLGKKDLIMLNKNEASENKEKWQAGILITAITLLVIILFSVRSK